MKIILSSIFTLLFLNSLLAQDFDKSKLDQLFQLIEEKEQGMGSLSIFQDGVEVYSNTIGFIDLESKKAANTETAYRVGSVTKSFTAVIIMKLVEDKKLKLNSPLSRWFPKMKNSSRITIEHMLRHRSGIYNFTNTDEYLNYLTKTLTREEVVEKVMEFGSAFDPDEDAEYSNSNYVLLSIIAEKVSKKPFDVLIQEMIAKPLGLKSTYYGGKINSAKNEANSFSKIKTWEAETETNMSIPIGAGALVSTPNDLNTFWTAFHSNQLVSEDSKAKMMRIEDGFGIGLFQIPFGTKKAYGHKGGIDGFQTMSYHFPKENMSVSYVGNAVVYPITDLMIDVLSIYFGMVKELPSFLPVMKLDDADLDQYVGLYKSDKFPLDITISKEKGQLMAQATGQGAFPLDAVDVHKFKFDKAYIKLDFDPSTGKLFMDQRGSKATFQRIE